MHVHLEAGKQVGMCRQAKKMDGGREGGIEGGTR